MFIGCNNDQYSVLCFKSISNHFFPQSRASIWTNLYLQPTKCNSIIVCMQADSEMSLRYSAIQWGVFIVDSTGLSPETIGEILDLNIDIKV